MTFDAGRLMFPSDALAGQHILVTGGGSGLGRVLAEAFARLGADIAICGRRGGVLDEAVEALNALGGGRARSHVCDISDETAITAMMDAIWSDHPLTGLVNNAAGNFLSRTETLSMRGFDAISRIVHRGTFNVTLEAGRRWIAEDRPGAILSIVATWVWNGSPFTVPSAMAKAAVKTMTESLAVEWGPRRIRLNCIAPGLFPTEGAWERLFPDKGMAEATVAAIPARRTGEMHELANLACFLMAPGADFLTGQTIAIDGGALLATGGNFSALSTWSDADWDTARARIREADVRDRTKRS